MSDKLWYYGHGICIGFSRISTDTLTCLRLVPSLLQSESTTPFGLRLRSLLPLAASP